MSETVVIMCCPECGSRNAGSIAEVGIEFDRMRCHDCGHEEVCDDHQIRFDWNKRVPKVEA